MRRRLQIRLTLPINQRIVSLCESSAGLQQIALEIERFAIDAPRLIEHANRLSPQVSSFGISFGFTIVDLTDEAFIAAILRQPGLCRSTQLIIVLPHTMPARILGEERRTPNIVEHPALPCVHAERMQRIAEHIICRTHDRPPARILNGSLISFNVQLGASLNRLVDEDAVTGISILRLCQERAPHRIEMDP